MARGFGLLALGVGALIFGSLSPATAQVLLGEPPRPGVEVNWDVLDSLGPESSLPGLMREQIAPAAPRVQTTLPRPVPRPAAPKADKPKAEKPKAEKVKADKPKAEAPRPVKAKAEPPRAVPTVDKPKMAPPPAPPPAVVPEKPKAEPPKIDLPKAEPPKVEPPKAVPPKVEPPKVEPPKAEPPKVEPPKVEAPKVEPPKVEAPKIELPKAEPPKVEPPKAAVTPPAPPAVQFVPPPPVAAIPDTPPAPVRKGDLLTVPFATDSARLSEGTRGDLERIAQRMEKDESLSLQLLAYAAGDEANASKARRLSLSRALELRKYLMEMGVRSTRIEVRALGNKVESGSPDRVDAIVVRR